MEKRFSMLFTYLLLFISFISTSWSQESFVMDGWKYIPQNEALFDQVEELRKTNKPYRAIKVSYYAYKSRTQNSLEKMEAKLFLAQNLWDVGLKAIAIEYYKEIIKESPGSFMALQSLLELNKNLAFVPYYQKEIQNLLNRGAFAEVPNGVDSMIQYFVALDNFEKGEYKWAFESLKKINSQGYWGENIELIKGIEFVKNGELKKAEDVFSQLIDRESVHPAIKQKSILQRARVYFELKQYDKSEQEYLRYESHGRDTGRVLYERALSSFYQKKYAFALGLLESLKSENFKTSFTPEHVILEMMIYRELCHYPTVKKIASEYEQRYKFLIGYFKSGYDLSKSQVIKKIIFQNSKFKESADLVNELRVERKDLRGKHTDLDLGIIEILDRELENYQKRYVSIIDKEIQPYLKSTAEYFMEKSEEIRLLEYVSGLDEFRIKNIFERREYKSENLEREKNYSTLYWPVKKEYWWEEFRNYQVLLVDRCNGATFKKEGAK